MRKREPTRGSRGMFTRENLDFPFSRIPENPFKIERFKSSEKKILSYDVVNKNPFQRPFKRGGGGGGGGGGTSGLLNTALPKEKKFAKYRNFEVSVYSWRIR